MHTEVGETYNVSGGAEDQQIVQAVRDSRFTWWGRLNRWLLPPTYYGDGDSDGPSGVVGFFDWLEQPLEHPTAGRLLGRLDGDVMVRFGLRDRLRILLFGTVRIWTVSKTEHDPGVCEARSTVSTD